MSAFLVTGATGFLGGALSRRLHRSGYSVFATGRQEQKLTALRLPTENQFTWDCRHELAASQVKKLEGVDTIVHCAAFSSAWGNDAAFWQANVLATENVLALAEELGVGHVIHISTPAVYFRFEDQFNVPETVSLPKPVNSYARTKSIAEQRVWESGLPATVLRPRGIYGAGDTALMPRLLRAAKSGPLPRFRHGGVVTDITHVDDVVDAILATSSAKPKAIGQVLNISGGEPLPITTIAERACAANNVTVKWRNLPVGFALRIVRLSETIAGLRAGKPEPRITAYGLGIFAFSQTLDISKAKKLLDWTPKVTFEDGLQCTFNHADMVASHER